RIVAVGPSARPIKNVPDGYPDWPGKAGRVPHERPRPGTDVRPAGPRARDRPVRNQSGVREAIPAGPGASTPEVADGFRAPRSAVAACPPRSASEEPAGGGLFA